MGELDIGTRPETIPTKQEIVGITVWQDIEDYEEQCVLNDLTGLS